MRALIVGVVIVGVVGLVLVGLFVERVDSRRRGPTDDELRLLVQAMARHLDRALGDPMERQSDRWEKQAAVLVERFYGKGSR